MGAELWDFRECFKGEVRRIPLPRTPVNSAAGIEPPSTKDYLRFPRGTFSLPNGKPAGTRRRNATWREKTGKAAPLRQAAPREARRTNGPKRTSSRGSANA